MRERDKKQAEVQSKSLALARANCYSCGTDTLGVEPRPLTPQATPHFYSLSVVYKQRKMCFHIFNCKVAFGKFCDGIIKFLLVTPPLSRLCLFSLFYYLYCVCLCSLYFYKMGIWTSSFHSDLFFCFFHFNQNEYSNTHLWSHLLHKYNIKCCMLVCCISLIQFFNVQILWNNVNNITNTHTHKLRVSL